MRWQLGARRDRSRPGPALPLRAVGCSPIGPARTRGPIPPAAAPVRLAAAGPAQSRRLLGPRRTAQEQALRVRPWVLEQPRERAEFLPEQALKRLMQRS